MIRRLLLTLLFVAAVITRAAEPAPRMLLLDGVAVGKAVIVVGERGTILHSTSDGARWSTIASSTTATLTGVTFARDALHGWAVGHDALILATADAGLTWQKQWQGENLADSFLDVIALDAQRAIAVGAYGMFLSTADGGRTWTKRKVLDDDYHLNRISRGPTGTLYLAGEHGILLRSADDGATWTRIPTSYDGSFYGVLPLDRSTLLAYGLRGHIFRSTDDGATWTRTETPRAGLLATAIRMGPEGDLVVFAGDARTVLLSKDSGKSTTTGWWSGELTTAVAELVVTPGGTFLALGEAGATGLGGLWTPPP